VPLPRRIVAVGGDGTVNGVAEWLFRNSSPGETSLGIIPGGTGNNLARGLGIPLHPDRAAEVALSGREERRIDMIRYVPVGSVEDPSREPPAARLVIQQGAFGFPAEINARFSELRKSRLFRLAAHPLGHLIYRFLALLGLYRRQLADRKGPGDVLRLGARLPGEDLEGEILAVFIGNEASIGGGFQPCPSASVDDGLMDLCIIRAGTGDSYWSLFRAAIRGEHVSMESAVEYRQTPGPLELHFSEPTPILADGDMGPSARSFRLELIPGGVAVVVG